MRRKSIFFFFPFLKRPLVSLSFSLFLSLAVERTSFSLLFAWFDFWPKGKTKKKVPARLCQLIQCVFFSLGAVNWRFEIFPFLAIPKKASSCLGDTTAQPGLLCVESLCGRNGRKKTLREL